MLLQLVAGHWWLIVSEALPKQHGFVDTGTAQLHCGAQKYISHLSPKLCRQEGWACVRGFKRGRDLMSRWKLWIRNGVKKRQLNFFFLLKKIMNPGPSVLMGHTRWFSPTASSFPSPSTVWIRNLALYVSFQGSDPVLQEYSYWNRKATMTSCS